MSRKGLKDQPANIKKAVRYIASRGTPCPVVIRKPKDAATVGELSNTVLVPTKATGHHGKTRVYTAQKLSSPFNKSS